MNFNQWAIKWGIPFEAVEDLRSQMGLINTDPESMNQSTSEAANQSAIRLEASQKGSRLWRNNSGATYDDKGNFIRYGLCNDSKQLNKKIKSSDLIGICPVRIQPYMVGSVIGQFLAREVKPSNWQYKNDSHEQAQLKFIELVNSLGGNAAFANKTGTIQSWI